jgi:hydrogenase maturation protease
MSDPRGGTALVVGLGNPLMGDDGLGLAALERLHEAWRAPPTVTLLDGGTWGLNLLHTIEASGQVLFLDAIGAGRAPGTLAELEGPQLPRMLGLKLSPHQIDLREVLALLELRGTTPATMACLGLEPASIELRTGLSPEVAAGLDALVDSAAVRLLAWGHLLRRRVASGTPPLVHAGAGLTGDPSPRNY